MLKRYACVLPRKRLDSFLRCVLILAVLAIAVSAVAVQADAQVYIKTYPAELRVETGKTATFTALAFERSQYIPNQKFSFVRVSGPASSATIRQSPEGNTEGPNSYSSRNLAEVAGLSPGIVTFAARIGDKVSQSVTVTVVDPAETPLAVIRGDNETTDGTIRARVGEAIEVNAESSTGTHRVEWFWGDGDRTGDLLSATHAYLEPGTYHLRLRVMNSRENFSESTVTVIVSEFPPPTRVFAVSTMAQLLTAYMQCTGGEHIVIPAGTVLIGQVELPAREFSDFVTIRSDGVMPEMAVRSTPRDAGYATLRGGHPGETPMIIKNRASKIRLSGLRFEPFANTDDTIRNYYLLQIGEAFGQQTLADNPSRIIVDHCLVYPPDNIQVVHAILNDGYKVSIISSWLGNIKTYGAQDSQAVFSLDGRGAHVYNNTYFEAASESILYGGAGNMIDGHVPENIEFRRCVFTKPIAWRSLPPNSVGDTVNIKNLFETKNARRVYVEGSLFSNHWDAGRSQYNAIVIKSTADVPRGGQGNAWAISEDIVFENNRVSHINGGMSVSREFQRSGVQYDPRKPRNIRLLNTLFDDLTFGRWGTTRSWAFFMSGVDDLVIRHVTVIDAIDTPDEAQELLLSIDSINSYRPEITDSILPLNYYGIRNTCGEGIAALNVASSGWFDTASGNSCGAAVGPTGGRWLMAGNVMPVLRTQPVIEYYPKGNFYPADYSQIEMKGYENCNISFLSDVCESSITNFRLRDLSPYKNAATDLTDPGINVGLLTERLRCTASGDTRDCLARKRNR